MAVDRQTAQVRSQTAERRQVTALSYDLVGSTRLAVQLDPEDLRALQRRFHETCSNAITHFDGHIGHYTGDGAMAFFGYPRAHEDDPERAIRAGLEILANCRRLNQEASAVGTEIAVRVGIATGLVVAGNFAGERLFDQDDVVGIAPNLAFKLQASAEPNTLVVSSATRELTAGLFQCRARPALVIAGYDKPQPSWQVVRARTRLTRSWNMRLQSVTPLVAREKELSIIDQLWGEAEAGSGQTILIVGEPGIGKSRLAAAIKEQVALRRHFTLTLQCSAQGSNTAFHPLIRLLERTVSTKEGVFESIVRRLRGFLSAPNGEVDEIAYYLARLVNRRASHPSDISELDPEEIKANTMRAAVELVERMSQQRPLLLVCEDIHWIDPTSEELLSMVVDRLSHQRVLMLATCRSGYSIPWNNRPQSTTLVLDRLDPRHTAAMIGYLAHGRDVKQTFVDRIVALADGIPLFIEELSRTAFGTRIGAASGQNGNSFEEPIIPATLSDSLTARLDQLGPGREIAQVCSIIGRSFEVPLVCKVANWDEESVVKALDGLVSQGLADMQGRSPDALYAFRHALIQESAYRSMLRGTRQAIHRRLAEILERDYIGTSDGSPEIIAHHLEEAGAAAEAINYLHEAARNAVANSANVEAIRLLERALRLLATLPESQTRDSTELSLLVSLGPPRLTLSGTGVPEVQEVYSRATALCDKLPYGRDHFAAHWGWWFTAKDNREAGDRANRLSALTGQLADEELVLQAHHCQWATQYCLADHRKTEEHLSLGLEIYDRGDFQHLSSLYGGHDAKSCGLGFRAMSQWMTGSYDRSLISMQRAVAHANMLGQKGSIRHAQDQQIMLYRFRGDAGTVFNLAEDMGAYAEEQGFKGLAAQAKVFKAWAAALLQDNDTAIRLMTEGLAQHMEVNTPEDLPIYYDMAAIVHQMSGEPEKGLPLLDEAVAIAERTGILMWLAELYRRKGILLLSQSRPDNAAALINFRRANAIAKEQGARAMRLRALCDLIRNADIIERNQACAELATLCAGLSEGSDFLDVVEARRLLHELGQ